MVVLSQCSAVTRQDGVLRSRLYTVLLFWFCSGSIELGVFVFCHSNVKLKAFCSFLSLLIFKTSDAHNPVVDFCPGQIMAQFFAIRGELTVLDA